MNSLPTTQYSFPQVRRIGKVLYFRGTVVVPLENLDGSIRPWLYTSSVNNYERDGGLPVTLITPYQGAGGVALNSNGSITFNSNGTNGQSVIPASVLAGGYSIDDNYSHPAGRKVIARNVEIGANTSTALSSIVSININQSGTLEFGLIKNLEESFISTNNAAWSTSPLNYVISHVQSGDYVSQFATANNRVYSSSVSGAAQNVVLDFPAPFTFPFTCNANEETDLGGFFTRIDGLTAFLN
jgi:hypothetical protein